MSFDQHGREERTSLGINEMSYSRTFSKCHPDKKHMARGMCCACYEAWRLRNNDPDRAAKHKSSNAYAKRNREKIRLQVRAWRARQSKEFLKDQDLKGLYGISLTDFNAMKEQQGNSCAICKKGRKLVVDHDHTTGEIRGLLCARCNGILGDFEHEEWRRSALAYLKIGV